MPGDKSISHRAVMLGALAEGVTEIEGFLPGADCLSTTACFRALGIQIEQPDPTRVIVHGAGEAGLQEPEDLLFVATRAPRSTSPWVCSPGRHSPAS